MSSKIFLLKLVFFAIWNVKKINTEIEFSKLDTVSKSNKINNLF